MAAFQALFCLLILLVINPASVRSKKCRALALEGGGDKGSWQAGVIYGLVSNLQAEEVQYDVVSGVSVGSIIGLYVSTTPKGEELRMAEELLYLWGNLTQPQVYIPWYNSTWSEWEVFYDQPSVYDNSPLKEYLSNYMKGKKVHRKISIGITDATNVESVTYDIEDLPNENITQLVIDSTSMPFMFPYHVFDNKSIFIDGGVLLNVNVHSAIRRCKELGVVEADIIIDVILPTGYKIEKAPPNQTYTGFDMLERYRDIVRFKAALDDIVHAFYDFKTVNFRYIAMPSESLPSSFVPLDFNHKDMLDMIELGKKDALLAINKSSVIMDHIKKQSRGGRVVKYIGEEESKNGMKGFLEIN